MIQVLARTLDSSAQKHSARIGGKTGSAVKACQTSPYERRMYHSAKLPIGMIANKTQGIPTLMYAMAPSAVSTKKPSPSGSSVSGSPIPLL
jgi:hypothetical protein